MRPRGAIFRSTVCILSISSEFVRFLSPFPPHRGFIGEVIIENFPTTTCLKSFPKALYHERTRAYTYHLLTAVVSSSHHHHAHVCGELCQNAVLDVKSKCASPSSRETTTFLDDDDGGHEEQQKQQQH